MKCLRTKLRRFIPLIFIGLILIGCSNQSQKPNIVFVFADQLRSQELSCNGGVNIQTPNLDRLTSEGLMMTNAISTYPICSPYRGMLLTGLYPLNSGVSNNDHPLPNLPSFARACKEAGYNTAYIGKWHLDGMGRSTYIPPERRLAYDYWKALECTHDYFNSKYYDNDGVFLLVAQGESVEGPTLQIGNTNSRYRFSIGAKEFINRWSKQGPAHHCAIGVGHIADKIEKLGHLLNINVLNIC